jgi:hypothetical protein
VLTSAPCIIIDIAGQWLASKQLVPLCFTPFKRHDDIQLLVSILPAFTSKKGVVKLQDLTQKFNELVTAEFQQSRNCTLGMKTPVLVNDYLNVLKQRTCAHDAIVSSGRHADILTTRAMLRDCDKTDTPFPAAATRMVQRAAVGSTPDNGAEPRCPKRPRLSLPIEEIHHMASPVVSRAGDAQTDQVTMGKARKTQHCGACKQP